MLYVEPRETLTASVPMKNLSPEAMDFKVMVALCTTGTKTIVASSPEIPLTLAGNGTTTAKVSLTAPGVVALYDSYVLAVYLGVDRLWHVAMADFAFEGVGVYVPGLQVTQVTWV